MSTLRTLIWLFTITAICATICTFITIHALYYLYCHTSTDRKINPDIKYLCSCSCISFTIACISQIIFLSDFNHKLLLNQDHSEAYMIFIQINMGLTSVGWALGEFFLYLLFIHRLYETYKDSIFKISKCRVILLYIPLVIFLVSQIINAVLGLCIYIIQIHMSHSQFMLIILKSLKECLKLSILQYPYYYYICSYLGY